MDREHIMHSEKYLICSSESGTLTKNKETFLYPLSNEEWNDITRRIPVEYLDVAYTIPYAAQNEYGSVYRNESSVSVSFGNEELAEEIVDYLLKFSL